MALRRIGQTLVDLGYISDEQLELLLEEQQERPGQLLGQIAMDMGLINAAVPHDKLDEEVDRWCTELMQKSPTCLKILKASFRTVYEPLRQESRRDWVKEIAPDFYRSGEADEGKNAFLERRESDFSRFPR